MNEILRIVFLIYFITHIPITLCIDLQGAFPEFYPKVLTDVFQWYLEQYNDVVMANPQPWLKSFLYCELLFQFPYFFAVTYGLLFRKNWIRIPSIAYGAHVSTTVVPIIAEVVQTAAMTEQQKINLLAVYSPYLLIPLTLMLTMCFSGPDVFGTKASSKAKAR